MGYGRGARMKIERDQIEWLAGVRAGETLGVPSGHADSQPRLGQLGRCDGRTRASTRRRCAAADVTRPRPGHADLVGVLKYDRIDARDILERASARETAARVAAGALARRLLDEFGVDVGSHVVSLGGVFAARAAALPGRSTTPPTVPRSGCSTPRSKRRSSSGSTRPRRPATPSAAEVEVVARGRPCRARQPRAAGTGSSTARLAGGLMSIPAVKAVEIGLGFEAAAARLRGARSDRSGRGGRTHPVPPTPAIPGRLPPPEQQRRRPRGRDDNRRTAGDPRGQ